MFARLGPWCHDHRRLILAVWLGVIVLVTILARAIPAPFRDDFNLPDVESRQGFDILDEHFGGEGTGITGTIVFKADQGVKDPEVKQGMEKLFATTAKLKGIDNVASPYSEEGQQQIASHGDEAGKIAFANVELPDDTDFSDVEKIRDKILDADPQIEGLQIELGGQIFAQFEEPNSELIGLAFAIFILIVAFGSVLAMGLPVGIALFGIGVGTGLITLLGQIFSVPDFATFLGVMIGLGVGIDYALLIVTRYREQLHHGHTVRESITVAMDTAGRSVLFAGLTVVISLLGMLLMGVAFVQGLAVAAAAVVLVTVLASLTLLPALLGFAGDKVERTRWSGLIAAGLVAVALVGFGLNIAFLGVCMPIALIVIIAGIASMKARLITSGALVVLATAATALVVLLNDESWSYVLQAFTGGVVVGGLGLLLGLYKPLRSDVPRREPKPRRETIAYRWSRGIQHRPWTAAIAGTVVLVVLAIPFLSLRLGFSDESNYPEDSSTKQAYNLLVRGFGEGFNGPLLLVAELPEGTDLQDLAQVTDAMKGTQGVVFASPATPNDPENPTAAIWTVIPEKGPQAEETTDLVNRLRDDVLPPVERELGFDIPVTGSVAVNIDFAEYLTSRLPYFFGAVLLVSFLFLMVVFRSILVPVKALIMNLLSIGAAYGVVVALFQWGWGDIGVQPAPIEPWAPMMLFAIVFGLSMDYEVFLLSRIREEWHRTGDSRTSVADGLAATAKVITAAAAIMVVVFGSFLFEQDRVFKLMGTGLAVAILLDATVVRMLLVPATMELLGDWNWWLPKWLDRILPNLDIEGHTEDILDEEEEADRESVLVGEGASPDS